MADKAFWNAIIEANYVIPDKAQLIELTDILLDYLASPEPDLRDTYGYGILARWITIYRYHSPEQLAQMHTWLIAQLPLNIGEVKTDSVFLRSYSAAILSLIMYRDANETIFDVADVMATLMAAKNYLLYERDMRPYEVGKGWINAIANATSLLRFLAMNKSVDDTALRGLLATIAEKVTQPSEVVYAHDEDDRLARVILAIMLRDELTTYDFVTWLQHFKDWQTTHETDGDYHLIYNHTYQNIKKFLRAILVQMRLNERLPRGAYEAEPELLDSIRDFSL